MTDLTENRCYAAFDVGSLKVSLGPRSHLSAYATKMGRSSLLA
jgi:hypothetical protein